MTGIYEFNTERLKLRQWRLDDYPMFAEMNACPKVMEYFPAPLSRTESDTFAAKISSLIAKRGWGLWAVEEKLNKSFIGFTGLHETPTELSFSPAIEIGWRLSEGSWGNGYATEAAKRVLRFAFEQLQLNEVVSFTSLTNEPSQAVMRRIDMRNANCNFNHPLVPADSELNEHVLYKINKQQWDEHGL
ncbi:MAG: GNAT family N-acetyltransferase [Pseudomonadota bacterium]